MNHVYNYIGMFVNNWKILHVKNVSAFVIVVRKKVCICCCGCSCWNYFDGFVEILLILSGRSKEDLNK
jgi:hypothetical protein